MTVFGIWVYVPYLSNNKIGIIFVGGHGGCSSAEQSEAQGPSLRIYRKVWALRVEEGNQRVLNLPI